METDDELRDRINTMVNTEWDIARINFESEIKMLEESLKKKSKYHLRQAMRAVVLLLVFGVALGIMIAKIFKL